MTLIATLRDGDRYAAVMADTLAAASVVHADGIRGIERFQVSKIVPLDRCGFATWTWGIDAPIVQPAMLTLSRCDATAPESVTSALRAATPPHTKRGLGGSDAIVYAIGADRRQRGLWCGVFDWSGECLATGDTPSVVTCSAPGDLGSDTSAQAFQRRGVNTLSSGVRAAGLHGAIRAFATVLVEAHRRSAATGNVVEAAILLRARDGVLRRMRLLAPAAELVNASDSHIDSMLVAWRDAPIDLLSLSHRTRTLLMQRSVVRLAWWRLRGRGLAVAARYLPAAWTAAIARLWWFAMERSAPVPPSNGRPL